MFKDKLSDERVVDLWEHRKDKDSELSAIVIHDFVEPFLNTKKEDDISDMAKLMCSYAYTLAGSTFLAYIKCRYNHIKGIEC